ncbi:MAG: XRE family transcriptional regulator, partial [Rickettsiales bacterium]
MKARKMRVGELGLLLEKTEAVRSNIITGTRKVTTDELVTIAHHLGCSAAELLGEKGAVAETRQDVPASLAKALVAGDVPGHFLSFRDELPEHVFFASEKKNLFAVRLKSESMNRMAPNGSFLIVDGNATDD